jgi:hypothetical protein
VQRKIDRDVLPCACWYLAGAVPRARWLPRSGRRGYGEQLVPFGRFGQVAVDSNLIGSFPEFRRVKRGQGTQHDLLSPAAAPNAQGRLEPIHLRHCEVEENDRRVQTLGELNGSLSSVRNVDFVTARLQKRRQRPSRVVAVVDDQYTIRSGRTRLLGLIAHLTGFLIKQPKPKGHLMQHFLCRAARVLNALYGATGNRKALLVATRHSSIIVV